ncbi:MAG: ABC-F type ribosomal protection protein [Clostridiales bacterium]|nr:ABC-F type ribosomal protection protein [Clostridiales bacterium]
MAELLLEATDIQLSFGIRKILDIKSLKLYDGDRIGLVGENGAGKTTLLNVLFGKTTPDAGEIKLYSSVKMIDQMGLGDESADGFTASEFSVKGKSDFLSGGERTRRRIAGALSGKAQILFADEPTVDLDEEGVIALEKKLRQHDGALILISHDRKLLDNVCTGIWELEDGCITVFSGNYSKYRETRRMRLEREKTEYEAQRAEEKRIKKLIQQEYEHAQQKQHLPSRMGNSEARLHKREVTNVQAAIHRVRKSYESRLDRMDEKKRPREDIAIKMALGDAGGITSKVCVRARGVSARFGANTLFEYASFVIPVGTRTALLGGNGAGKTTLIRKIINADAGITVSPGVKIGYFGQMHTEVLDENLTALQNARAESDKDEATARTVLARLNLPGDNVFKKVSVLSGGERAKVALARLLLSNANFLILDEPTNHLDIFSLEALESLLSGYSGTLLFVSHDREFINKVATRMIRIENKRVTSFEGTIEEYERTLVQKEQGRAVEERKMYITSLEMRLAAIAARMAKPQKGDKPEALNEEYEKVVDLIREEKRKETT